MAEKFDDDMLDDLFAAARNDSRATPSPDLLARVLSEAEGLQVAEPVPSAPPLRPSLWAALVAAVGGWPALSGVAMAGVAGVWFGVPMLALVIAVAMFLTQIAAALGGILIPMALERLNIDPALASGPFVTTVTDVVGFFLFLGLAAHVLL